jgi:transcription elongation factor Elf1
VKGEEMSDKLRWVHLGDDGLLHCPICGGSGYLHQYEVEVGWRAEDSDGVKDVSSHDTVRREPLNARNVASPGGYGYRRQYLVIRFYCEVCGHDGIELCIWQHKGQTYAEWVSAGVKVRDA